MGRPYRHGDGRYAFPSHSMYTDDWEYIEALFPGATAAWAAVEPHPSPRYYPVIRPPHLAIEDSRCWSDMHVPDSCDCHTWDHTGRRFVPWLRGE